jgi:hypothetical protein
MSAHRPNAGTSRSGTLLGWLILAGLTILLLDLVGLATAAPRMAAQALDRSADAVVTLERHARRSGHITSYPIRF